MQGTPAAPTAQPRTAASLRAEIDATQTSLDETLARRVDAAARREVTDRPGERARLGGDLRRLDGEVNRLTEQLAGLKAQLRLVEAAPRPTRATDAAAAARPALPQPAFPALPAPPAPPSIGTTTPPSTGIDHNTMVLGGVLTVFVLAPLAFAIAWRLIRRVGAPISRAELAANDERLRRIEQAVDTIAVEVERISENQRFLTNTIASDGKLRSGL